MCDFKMRYLSPVYMIATCGKLHLCGIEVPTFTTSYLMLPRMEGHIVHMSSLVLS